MALGANQIADLPAAQWRSPARVVGRHHCLPDLALRRAAANRLYRDRAQIGQAATDLRSGRTRFRGAPLRRPATRCRKLDLTTPLKLDQMLAAGHLLQSTAPILPPQPLTNLLSQPITRNASLRAARADPRQMICSRELLSRRKGRHAPCLTQFLFCVQRHLWEMISPLMGEGRGGGDATAKQEPAGLIPLITELLHPAADHVEQRLALLDRDRPDRAVERRGQCGRVFDPFAIAAGGGTDLLEGG